MPQAAPDGSRITAATSPGASVSARAGGSAGTTITELAIPAGSPAVSGWSNGGSAPTATWSCQPWKCPASLTILSRPVTARASRSASSDASVPLDGEADPLGRGDQPDHGSAQSLSSSWPAPGWNELRPPGPGPRPPPRGDRARAAARRGPSRSRPARGRRGPTCGRPRPARPRAGTARRAGRRGSRRRAASAWPAWRGRPTGGSPWPRRPRWRRRPAVPVLMTCWLSVGP